MNKCKKCGNEFEGKFCPECGEKVTPFVVFDEFEVGEVADVATSEPLAPQPQNAKTPFKFAYLTKISTRFIAFSMAAIVLLFVFFASLILKESREFMIFSSQTQYKVITSVCGVGSIISIAVCAVMLTNKRPVLNYRDMLTRRKEYKRCLIGIVFMTVAMVGSGIGSYVLTKDVESLILIICFPFVGAGYSAVFIVGLSFIKKIEKEYITKNPDGTVTDRLIPLVNASVEKFKNANALREQNYNARRVASGKVAKTSREIEIIFFFKKLRVVVPTVILISIFLVVGIIASNNIFETDFVEKISVGDDIKYVTMVLGDPYDKREIRDSNDKVLSGTYFYSSSELAEDIAKINKKLEKLEDAEDFDDLEEMIKLSDKLLQLEEKLAKTRCDYITVTFADSYGTLCVTSISFLKDCYYGSELNGKVTKITYAAASSSNYYKYGNAVRADANDDYITVNARLYFNDGSLINKQIKVEIDPLQHGTQNISWSDSYGTHEITVIVK